MIQLITGPPRCGKSYFACNYLWGFCRFDALYNEYILNPEILIISNIEGLRLKHWRLDVVLKAKPLLEFFTMENFENILKTTKKSHVILLIDECHKIFPASMLAKEQKLLYDFFAEHGHIGLDVFLMTQGLQSMARLFNPLIEFVVKVGNRSKAIAGTFSYTFTDMEGKYLYPRVLTKNKLVFGIYKSFRHDEQNKPKSALLQWTIIVAMFFSIGGGIFYYAIHTVKQKSINSKVAAQALKDKDKPISLSPPQAVAAFPAQSVVVTPTEVVVDPVQWRSYGVDGYIEYKGNSIYQVRGHRIGGERTRNFDRDLMLIEVYGLEIPPAPRAQSAGAGGSTGLMGGAASPRQGEALAEPTALGSKWLPDNPKKKFGVPSPPTSSDYDEFVENSRR
jgi:hypothetical protein